MAAELEKNPGLFILRAFTKTYAMAGLRLGYCLTADRELLEEIASGASYRPRAELIAPLDCLLWDRRLVEALFDFSYTWEIYTPRDERRFGYYVLPLLTGERFSGRVEAVAHRQSGVLEVRGVWWEGRPQRAALEKCLRRFARFNGCTQIQGPA